MKISTEQLNKVLEGKANTPNAAVVDEAVIRLTDAELIKEVVANIEAAPDREDMIASLKSRVESGEYNPSGSDIADAMIRRTVADRIR